MRNSERDPEETRRAERAPEPSDGHGLPPARGPQAEPRLAFEEWVAAWRREREPVSSPRQMAMHPAYQRIIGMGPAALPLILRELERQPDHWFWALQAITGVDPVPADARGNMRDMAGAWVAWGKDNGLTW